MNGILVADDQQAVRLKIVNVIREMQLDFGPVYEAGDGLEAIQIIQQHHPEIALVDIVMPNLDGLALIEQMKQDHSDTHFIIVSSHHDFEYAKKAINFKVDAYILKPISGRELQGVLIATMDSIHKEGLELEKFKEKEVQHFSMLLFEYLTGMGVFIEMKHIVEGMKVLTLVHPYYQLAVIRFPDTQQDPANRIKRQMESELRDDSDRCLSFTSKNDELVYLFNMEKPDNHMVATLEKCLSAAGHDLHCGMSMTKKGIVSVKALYTQTSFALKESMLKQTMMHVFSQETEQLRFFLSIEEMGKVQDALLKRGREELEQNLERIFVKMTREKWSAGDVENGLIDLVNYILLNTKNMAPEICDMVTESRSLREAKDIFHMKIAAKEIIDRVYKCMEGRTRKDTGNQAIEQICRYVQENFSRDISLSIITNKLNMNYHYISGLFARKVGLSFSEYLMKVRLEKAKELLRRTEGKIYEVAVGSGFNDVQYFCRAFKKQFALTPAQYRKSTRNPKL